MGFDLHGMNPNLVRPAPKLPPMPERTKKDWEKYHEWEDENCGTYFRNNVWFWRPLWSYVASVCWNILSDKDIEKGSWNDGHKISKTKAKRIASRLRRLIREGHVASVEAKYKNEQDKLPDGDWDKAYPFNEENVRQFSNFCENSGGFEIC